MEWGSDARTQPVPIDVTRISTLDRLVQDGNMFIRDGSGAIGSAVSPTWLHQSPHHSRDCLEIGACAKSMRNCARSMAGNRPDEGQGSCSCLPSEGRCAGSNPAGGADL